MHSSWSRWLVSEFCMFHYKDIRRAGGPTIPPDVLKITELATADHGNIICDPFMVGDTFFATVTAIGGGCAPPPDLIKVVQAVVHTALRPEQLVALTGIQADRDVLEPCRQVTLDFRIERPFHPLVSTVGM